MKNRSWIVILLLVLAAGAYLYSRPTAAPATSAPAPAPSSQPPPKSAATAKKRAAVPRPSSPSRPPKPIRAATAAPAPPPPPGDAPTEDAKNGPVDRRENSDPDAARQLAEIREGMDLVSEDIGECISAWEALYPALNGRVNVAFTLNADGLQEAWIMEATDIPPGPLSCFSAAVWGVEWAGVVRDPVEVTFPFVVSSDEEKEPSKLQ